jgi:hypothetical protein
MKSLLALYTLAAAVSAKHQGAVRIRQDGKRLALNVAALEDRVTTAGDVVTMRWGGEVRAFVTLEAMEDMPPGNYYNFTLFNKELSYDTDLSAVGCSCNAALFFTAMPGYSRNGSQAHGSFNPYYCDANDVGGVWCWEYDSMEANKYALHVTPHKCSGPAGQYIGECDKGGCSTSAVDVNPKSMCPDDTCTIDTRRPFRVVQRFEGDISGEKLVRITNRLVQGDAVFDMSVCDPEYLQEMSGAFKGNMVMVFQVWGDGWEKMRWLDESSGCKGGCNTETAVATFSDIQINSIESDTVTTVVL